MTEELKPCPFCGAKSDGTKMQHATVCALAFASDNGFDSIPVWAWNTRVEDESDKRDAERYRYIRSRDLDTIQKGGVFAGMTPENLVLNGKELDEEIDKASTR